MNNKIDKSLEDLAKYDNGSYATCQNENNKDVLTNLEYITTKMGYLNTNFDNLCVNDIRRLIKIIKGKVDLLSALIDLKIQKEGSAV